MGVIRIEKHKLGPKLYIGMFGIWWVKNEKRISIFLDKKSQIVRYVPRTFWHQWNNADVAQRSLYL